MKRKIKLINIKVSLSQTETESEFSEMDSMVYSSSTSVMSQIAYHQRCQEQLQQQFSMEEQSDIERGSSTRKLIFGIRIQENR